MLASPGSREGHELRPAPPRCERGTFYAVLMYYRACSVVKVKVMFKRTNFIVFLCVRRPACIEYTDVETRRGVSERWTALGRCRDGRWVGQEWGGWEGRGGEGEEGPSGGHLAHHDDSGADAMLVRHIAPDRRAGRRRHARAAPPFRNTRGRTDCREKTIETPADGGHAVSEAPDRTGR